MRWLHEVRAQDQEKPWFMYYSTGCAHAPHQVAVEWSEKYRGKFDQGWDRLREETFERQKQLGVIPPEAELTPRPDALPAWDSLSDDEKKLYARQMEVYAGFEENADWNVGRLLDAIEELGELDNTLVLYIFGDNGASLEGTITGSFNELTMQNGIALTPEQQLSLIDQYGGLDAWGTDAFAPHYADRLGVGGQRPVPVGQAGRLPPRRHAQPDGRLLARADQGRRRDPLAVHALHRHRPDDPRSGGAARGEDRRRHRAEADGGHELPLQLRRRGRRRSGTRCSTSRSIGNRAIYKDGWWAACMLDRIPWDASPPTIARFAPGTYDPEQDTWELYYLPDDYSQANDVAAEHPEKLAELKELFWQEAEKHNVLPLLAGFSVFFGMLPPMPTVTTQTFYGDVQNIASGMIPRIYGRSYAIEAELSVPDGGAEGVIVAEADEMGGFSLWVDENGLLHHSYSMMGVEHYKQVSTQPIPTGDVTVRMQFDADRQERSAGGTVSLYANDEKIGEGRIEKTVFFRFSGVRRHGHRPRQRARRRPRLRGQGALPVHGHGEEGRLRPQAGNARGREGAARGDGTRRDGARHQRVTSVQGGAVRRRHSLGRAMGQGLTTSAEAHTGPVLTVPDAPAAFHLLAKPTGAVCNLDCAYCFFLSKEMLYPGSRFRMADELLETYLRQLIEAHASSTEVTIAWQGGEPTLTGLGSDFFRRSIELAATLQPGQRGVHTIQTNRTLIDEERAAFFREHGFLGGNLDRRPARAARHLPGYPPRRLLPASTFAGAMPPCSSRR